MPMHDWTRVDAFDYHSFHLFWIASVSSTLNRGHLPEGYYAMADHSTPPITPDVAGRKKKLAGRRRVAIKHVRDRQIVGVIEIVSPSNKAKKEEFNDLVGKSVQLLRQGVHVLLIDPFPPTRRDPNGIHAAVWKELTGKKVVGDANKALTLASYAARGDDTYSAFVEPMAVGDPFKDMPLFITPERHVPVPLEETYRTAWNGYPAPLRKLLESR